MALSFNCIHVPTNTLRNNRSDSVVFFVLRPNVLQQAELLVTLYERVKVAV